MDCVTWFLDEKVLNLKPGDAKSEAWRSLPSVRFLLGGIEELEGIGQCEAPADECHSLLSAMATREERLAVGGEWAAGAEFCCLPDVSPIKQKSIGRYDVSFLLCICDSVSEVDDHMQG